MPEIIVFMLRVVLLKLSLVAILLLPDLGAVQHVRIVNEQNSLDLERKHETPNFS